MSADLVAVARRWLQAGFSVIPVQRDKRPAVNSWADQQVRPYELDELERAFADPKAERIAIVAGYGGLVCFDFDPDKRQRALEPFDIIRDFYTPWADTAEGLGVTPAVQDTQSGGRHALVVCPNPTGSAKLAHVPAQPDARGNTFHTTIETKGVKGYFVLHDLTVDPQSIPSITQEQYLQLLEAAMLLNRVEDTPDTRRLAQAKRGTGEKANATRRGLVGWFNERYSVQEVLKDNGYVLVGNKYLSPESTTGNAGVTIFKDDRNYELCYSHHSDVLGDGHAHDAFDTFKLLEHGGDFDSAKEAVKKLKDAGRFTFGSSRARGDSAPMSTNRRNAVQDATTICAHDLSTNQDLSSKEPDLSSNTPPNEHKSESESNAVQDGKTRLKVRPRADLSSNGEHKQTSPSPSQKPDLSSNASEATRLPSITKWGERDRPPDVQWLVHNLIQDNAENLIAGEPGVGKSWISGDLAVAVATGSQFLERHTRQGPVLIINFDDPSESLPRMFAERAARGREYSFKDLPIYYWQPEENKPYPPHGLVTEGVFEFLLAEVKRIKPRVIIIDAYSSAFPGLDGNKGQDVIEAFEALRQLRTAAPKPCSLVLVDHTPKATLQDSKRRGVSGSQQKHAKTRTVHIIRHVDPSEVNGDDVLEWEVFKANAAPRQEPFGVNREMDSLLNTANLTTRQLPERGPGGKDDRAARTAITILQARPNEPLSRQDLLSEVVSMANVSMATARRGLSANTFVDHPLIQQVELGGRGAPIGFMYVPESAEIRVSLYEQFRAVVNDPRLKYPRAKDIQEIYELADAGDDDAKDRIDQYLARDDVRDWLTRNYPKTQEGKGQQ